MKQKLKKTHWKVKDKKETQSFFEIHLLFIQQTISSYIANVNDKPGLVLSLPNKPQVSLS